MIPDPPHLSPANSNFSVNGQYTVLSGEKKKDNYSPDDVLAEIGESNRRLLIAMFSASVIWILGAMPLMASSFTSDTNHASMHTIVDEFNLTEDRAYLAEIPTTAYMAGNMIGGTVLTQASDRFGRRPILLLSLACFSLSGMMASFSPSITIYSCLRALQGCFYTGCTVIGWVAGYEMSPPKMRPLATLVFGLGWLVGYSLVAPMAYYAATWRQLLLYTAFPALPFAGWAYFALPETLHYLASRRKTVEMGHWITKICGDGQKIHIQPEQIQMEQKGPEVNAFREVLANKRFLVYFIAMVYLWVCDTFTYFGLSLYSTQLSGNKWVNYLLMGLVELPAYIFTPWLIKRFGRRFIVVISHFVAGLAFLSLLASAELPEWVVLMIWLIGKSAITLSFMVLFVYASEVFPTDIRNASVGLCVVIARFGGMAAPQIKNMALLFSKLPEITLSTVCLLGALITLLLPETANRPLPASIRESTEKKPLI
ncbi:unnamed protein product, partial [Mesorhabditis spiculigera]